MYRNGELEPVSETADREMYHEALRMMRTAGYEHYEISNCALRGYRSRHNMKYWSYDEYAGLGLGASSFMDGSRYRNCSRVHDYIRAIKENVSPVDAGSVKNYSKREEMGIYVFTGLRKAIISCCLFTIRSTAMASCSRRSSFPVAESILPPGHCTEH